MFGIPISSFFDEAASSAAPNAELFTLLEPTGAIDLVRAYVAIQDLALRHDVLALTRTASQLASRSIAQVAP